jgi:lysophospholipid acyltransferase (LPLAT)-like uncharacterized protein
VQGGLLKIAQSTGCEIVPIHIRYSSAWRLSSWDGFVLPKPFSRVIVTFDSPRTILKNLSEEEFEAERIKLEDCLVSNTDDA